MKKIIAFSGSNRDGSINQRLATYAAQLIQNQQVTVLDLRDYDVPIYSSDIEKSSGVPAVIQELKTLFSQADGFIIASPEHNSSIPAFFKNIIDWLSRIEGKTFNNKPTLLLSTSPGGRGGASNMQHLLRVMPFWGAQITGHYSLGRFHDIINETTQQLRADEHEKLLVQVSAFMIAIEG